MYSKNNYKNNVNKKIKKIKIGSGDLANKLPENLKQLSRRYYFYAFRDYFNFSYLILVNQYYKFFFSSMSIFKYNQLNNSKFFFS